MGVAGIADDIVKGIKKFGKEVVEGAKDGPGKAARIKKTATLNVNGHKMGLSDVINKTKLDAEDVVKRGRKNIDDLSDYEKVLFKEMNHHADSAGNIKNYEELVAGEMDRIRRMSDEEVVNSYNKFVRQTGINTRPEGVSDADFVMGVRNDIDKYIEPGTKTAGRVVGDFAGGGIYGSYNAYKNMADGKKSIIGAIKEGHSVVNDAGEKVISGKRVAGTAATVAGAASLGNRVFRDEYGELDVPIVPFI